VNLDAAYSSRMLPNALWRRPYQLLKNERNARLSVQSGQKLLELYCKVYYFQLDALLKRPAFLLYGEE
jgi:hypothetical protein